MLTTITTLRQHLSRASLTPAAYVTAAMLMLDAKHAFAQGGIARMSNTLTANLETIPQIIGWVAYIAGGAIGIAGIFKLKQHVDNPAQVGLKDGLIRLAAGGGLIALPFVLQSMIETLGGTAGGDLTGSRPRF